MNRTTPERRANRRRKIARRKRLINNLNEKYPDIKDGYLDNNNEMNKYSNKSKPKHPKSKHDQRQVDSMDEQESDASWSE